MAISQSVRRVGFATGKAELPNRFVLWLQNELQTRYGLVTEVNSKGTGLISKSVQPTQQTVEVAEESPFVSDTAAEKIKMIDPGFALLYKDGTKELERIIKLAKNDNISLEQFKEILEKLEKC